MSDELSLLVVPNHSLFETADRLALTVRLMDAFCRTHVISGDRLSLAIEIVFFGQSFESFFQFFSWFKSHNILFWDAERFQRPGIDGSPWFSQLDPENTKVPEFNLHLCY